MKKVFRALAFVIALATLCSVSAFATDAADVIEGTFSVDMAGATNAEGITVDPSDTGLAVDGVSANGAGYYYGILLASVAEGSSVPTASSQIYYINQVSSELLTAADAEAGTDATYYVNFGSVANDADNVLPIVPTLTEEVSSVDMKLFISSNDANASLVSIPVTYAAVPQEPTGPAVTFMNGADTVAADLVTDADGNVTLPANVAFNKTVNTGYTFTHYSWVTADGATEYLAGAKVAATALENITLYAKYDTGIIIGDINGSQGTIESIDRTQLHQYISTDGTRKLGNMGKTFAELTGVADLDGTVGDINGSQGTVESIDRTQLHQYISTDGTRKLGNVGKTVYYVNK